MTEQFEDRDSESIKEHSYASGEYYLHNNQFVSLKDSLQGMQDPDEISEAILNYFDTAGEYESQNKHADRFSAAKESFRTNKIEGILRFLG
ncbi:MAG: hypothetical protein H6765_08750 [Candidatus Peribacteria bacterium]|nr:MAG: hypothetical protein H6765_08750 [Candidatus Peribacteria bacterium]